ncbi:DMT family transporter [Pseudonocardia abyssalis]|uniref:DMT family transporter n=1 Tax=Pseudonocardia abyssalis TaxID=2792008 RepID=A0ABS6V1Y4_9PSEU|nr:DMT family transporter [Pseudonocardia abyssalis]MBW0115154.1 DMT family transporter [Pseudonocardia abyssalis]MBW0138462.1 DMT family transporter [Pseudonocardia abyssalis]
MIAILLALGTALGYGVANYLAPVLGRRMPLAAVLLGSQLGGLAVSVLLTLGSDLTMDAAGLAFAVAAGASNAGALACLYRAAQTGNLSVISPVAASGAAVPVLVGLASGDRPGPWQLVGIPLVLVGIVLAARRPPTGPGGTRGIGWALGAAALFGTFLTTYAGAAADSSSGALVWSRVALVLTTGLGILMLRAPVRVAPRDGALVLVPGLLLALGTFAFGEATRIGLLSVVSVIATLNPVVTVVLAFALLRERPAAAQRTGAALALTGIVLLAIA